VFLLRTNLN